MLQIRLSKAPASEGSGGAKLSPVETVTVACPDHLVLADLPVAKGIGAATAASLVKTLGRRSRRQLGERVHFCVRCDFPIAIYGRLSPCEHAFCLDCARSDSMCYLCDERIQKIQTIKMMEGILICAAPHCLKSFLKKADFESHIQDSHANLLRPNADKDEGNESEAQSVRQSTASDSTARGPQRPVFSPGSNSQQHDLEDKTRRQPPREQPPSRPTLQPKPPFFGQQHHPSDTLSGSVGGIQQGFHQQSFDMQHPPQEPSQFSDRQQAVGPETPFPEYPTMHSAQPSNIPSQVTSNPMLNPPMPFGYPPYPHERAQPFYAAPYDMPRQDSASDIGGDQSSLLGFPQGAPSGPNFPGNFPQAWNAGIAGVPFEQAQGGMVVDPRDSKGILAPQPMPLPPPPPPPPHMSHLKQNYYSGELGHDAQGYGWQHDNRDSFGGQG
ncbi:E3 ubiquitin-protein ligase HAKAI homolog [Gastrolobium bilobum]|uniref:E3 ubiquitin-protein ligase HAKAI homolog n=1 Tax=Gastrolobium bilobum TaxID=150636 RepID=UPI002AAFD826|nr:E3 ubiquitin-protein ligase HAKAI homolog [Gastrolobium bilobum]